MAHDTSKPDLDVVIIGAGLSGIGAAYRLQENCPDHSYAILEGRDHIGGTWDLFKYPGARSDSDIYTFAYSFKPWTGEHTLGTAEEIRTYIETVAQENGIDHKIRYGHHVTSASWSSQDARWTINLHVNGVPQTLTCSFLYTCAGYYDYNKAHQPRFPGMESFSGDFVHPQFWPDDLDYAGKRVTVIGSGATAISLGPALVKGGATVTMVQRSPSYFVPIASTPAWLKLARNRVPAAKLHPIARSIYYNLVETLYFGSRHKPGLLKAYFAANLAVSLRSLKTIRDHFTPVYQPWDERLCVVPDNDLLKAVRKGQITMVTDQVHSIEPDGVRTATGNFVESDVIVSATGLVLRPIGGITLNVDGQPVDLGQQVLYRGGMVSSVPNYATAFGYANAAWTLRADLTAQFVCRVLTTMTEHNTAYVVPGRPPVDMDLLPPIPLSSGHVQRHIDEFPKVAARPGYWEYFHNYKRDIVQMAKADPLHELVHVSWEDIASNAADRSATVQKQLDGLLTLPTQTSHIGVQGALRGVVMRAIGLLPPAIVRRASGSQPPDMAPDVATMLQVRRRAGLPDFGVQEVVPTRHTLRADASASTGHQTIGRVTDLSVSGGEGNRRARLYEPRSALDHVTPLVIFVHGGAFIAGDLISHDGLCRYLAERIGVRVMALDYRLAPENPFPAGADDVRAALGWVRCHAQKLRVDADRIVMAGDSAGANLAYLVACEAAEAGHPVTGQALLYPFVDLARDGGSRETCASGFYLHKKIMHKSQTLYAPGRLNDPDVSVLHRNIPRNLGSTIVTTAGFDPLCDEGHDLVAALRAAKIDVTHLHERSLIHGYANMLLLPSALQATKRFADAVAVQMGPERILIGLSNNRVAEPV